MRVVSISDTHTLHERIEYPEGDILLHSGDILNSGYFNELNDLLPWANRGDDEGRRQVEKSRSHKKEKRKLTHQKERGEDREKNCESGEATN